MNDITRDELVANYKLNKLADELEIKDPAQYATIIERCRNGDYLDFSSDMAMPKMQMHTDLLEVGLVEIDKLMQNGEYDT